MQLQSLPTSLQPRNFQPKVSLLNHSLIQYQKSCLVWKRVKRKWASHPDNTSTTSISFTVGSLQSARSLCHPHPTTREVLPPSPLQSHPNCLQATSSYFPLSFHSLYLVTSSHDHLSSSHYKEWKQGSASYHTISKHPTSSSRQTGEHCQQLHQPSDGWAASPGVDLQLCY